MSINPVSINPVSINAFASSALSSLPTAVRSATAARSATALPAAIAEASRPASSSLAAPSPLFAAVFDSLMQGMLIVNGKRELVQANARAQALCGQLAQAELATKRSATQALAAVPAVPEVLWRLCEALLASRQEFPGYGVIPETLVQVESGTELKVCAQWLYLAGVAAGDRQSPDRQSYILITLEDCSERSRNLARWDALRYGLSRREAEVWLWKCQGYSYEEIADELYISRNTVKKHLRSITLKRGMASC
ncbi:MAG: hypothetical protein HC824_10810 [Synechococcales cyanobacterium RM1_1_8]|nr:hypothetical protein [Synechococcales cyanobacterium RM1_1_8]